MITNKTKRIRHTQEFKAEAFEVSRKIGVVKIAKQLSLYESQLYAWRKAVCQHADVSDSARELAAESAKLKRLLAKQAEKLEIVKSPFPTSRRI